MRGLDDTEQRAAKVDNLELGRACVVGPHDLSAQQPQHRGLAALRLTENEQMGLLGEIRCDGL